MNIIFLAEKGHYRNWGPKHYNDLLRYVKDNMRENRVYLFYSHEEYEWEDVFREINPDMVVFFDTDSYGEEMRKFVFVFNWKIPIVLVLLDMFYPLRLINDELVRKTFSLVHFGKASKLVEYYRGIFPEKYITSFKSRFINGKRFYDRGEKKLYDIIFYGTRNYYYNFKNENIGFMNEKIKKLEEYWKRDFSSINFYFLRERLENLLKKYQYKYKILFLPEKNSYESKIKNEELSKLLNQSKLVVSCATLADVCMHKYFEIIGSGSMVLGNIPSDFRGMFEGKICEVNEFMSDDEIISKIDFFLNDVELLGKTRKLCKKIHQDHNFDVAVKNFGNVFLKIHKEYNKKVKRD